MSNKMSQAEKKVVFYAPLLIALPIVAWSYLAIIDWEWPKFGNWISNQITDVFVSAPEPPAIAVNPYFLSPKEKKEYWYQKEIRKHPIFEDYQAKHATKKLGRTINPGLQPGAEQFISPVDKHYLSPFNDLAFKDSLRKDIGVFVDNMFDDKVTEANKKAAEQARVAEMNAQRARENKAAEKGRKLSKKEVDAKVAFVIKMIEDNPSVPAPELAARIVKTDPFFNLGAAKDFITMVRSQE